MDSDNKRTKIPTGESKTLEPKSAKRGGMFSTATAALLGGSALVATTQLQKDPANEDPLPVPTPIVRLEEVHDKPGDDDRNLDIKFWQERLDAHSNKKAPLPKTASIVKLAEGNSPASSAPKQGGVYRDIDIAEIFQDRLDNSSNGLVPLPGPEPEPEQPLKPVDLDFMNEIKPPPPLIKRTKPPRNYVDSASTDTAKPPQR